MRAVVAVVMLVALTLAGCSGGGGDGGPEATSTTSSSGTSTGTASSTASKTATGTGSTTSTGTSTTGQPKVNHAPDVTFAAATLRGAVPFKANFTFNATDSDGDAMTWTLSFGDGSANVTGDVLPGARSHDYTLQGAFNATLRVSDGKESTVRKLVINTTVGAKATKQFAGTIAAPDPLAMSLGICFVVSASSQAGPETFGASFDIPGLAGWAYAFDVAGVITLFSDATGNAVTPGGASGTVPADRPVVYTCGSSEESVMLDYVLAFTEP